METRELTADQRTQAVALWEAAGLVRAWNPPDADFDRALAGPTSTVLGTFDGDVLVATAMVGHDGHRGWVYYVAVDATQRRASLGREVMRAAERWLVARGAVKVQLMVRATNAEVLEFYERVGYAAEDVTVMSRWL
ncbi:MAG TPA: GNAT family acetyltransferase [Acidimicrobiales bacterium]|nr:GNAT family acetyltransferase [Acidimicrobiales bacterium]